MDRNSKVYLTITDTHLCPNIALKDPNLLKHIKLLMLVLTWIIVAAVGFSQIASHVNSPSRLAHARALWSEAHSTQRAQDQCHLLLCGLPKCSCKSATQQAENEEI